MVLLNSVGEGILGAIVTFGSLALLFGGFIWLFQKFLGTEIVSKHQIHDSFYKAQEDENIFNRYLITNPDIIERAIISCKKKRFSKTHTNILSEFYKIQKSIEKEKKLQKTANSYQNNSVKDYERKRQETFTKNSIIVFNTLYFEFENEILTKMQITSQDLFNLAYKKDPTLKIINSYDQLFNLYKVNLLTKEEFIEKKRKMIYNIIT